VRFCNLSFDIVKFCWLAPMVFPLRVGGLFHIKYVCLSVFDLFLSLFSAYKLYQSLDLVIHVLVFPADACMTTMKYDIPMVDFDMRFLLWQVKMWAVLAHHDLDDALEGFRKTDQKAWTPDEARKDRKSLSMIHLQLSNNVLKECLEEKYVVALWLKLESICIQKDLTSKMHIKMKLFTHKLRKGGSVLMHISMFKEIVINLTSMEVKFDDEDLALLLWCSLPASYNNFRDTILYSHDELTMVKVYEAFTGKEKVRQMVNSKDVTDSSGKALNVYGLTEQKKSNSAGKGKGNQKGHSKSKGPPNELFCRYCKRKNQNIENYSKVQNKEKRNDTSKPKGKTDRSAFVASNNSSDNGDALIAFVRYASDDSLWILDHAHSYHVCINKALFSTYEPVQNGGIIWMGDNSPCEVVGMDTV
jgi:hypothetical protein